jgi:hypothetical protein
MIRIVRLGMVAAVLAAGAAAASPAVGWAARSRPAVTGASRADSVRPVAGPPAAITPGTRLWVGRYSAPGASDDRPSDLAVSPSGSTVYVTGSTEYPNATGSMPVSYFGTVAYSAVTGKRLWVERFLGPGNAAFCSAVAVSPDGSEVFVTGQAAGDIATVAYNATTGHYLWSRLYKDPVASVQANAVTVSPDGSEVFVTGGGSPDLDTVAYNAVTGALLWAKRIPGNAADGIVASPDDSTVYVASGSGGGASAFTTVAYSAATGHERWISSYPGPAYPTLCSLAGNPDGTEVFTACDAVGARYLTLGYDAANGKQLWQAMYQHDSYPTVPNDVAASDSQVFVTGESNEHMATVAYNSDTGRQQWVNLYPKPGNTSGNGISIVVSPDGSTVYAGGGANSSFAIVAFDQATGALQWARQWFGVGGGSAAAVAVSPSGDSVFATGVTGLPAGNDSFSTAYGTVAYKS